MTKDKGEKKKRQFHLPRSRLGCESCRTQRKKCDERRPGCSRCTKTNKECCYDRTADTLAPKKHRRLSAPIAQPDQTHPVDSIVKEEPGINPLTIPELVPSHRYSASSSDFSSTGSVSPILAVNTHGAAADDYQNHQLSSALGTTFPAQHPLVFFQSPMQLPFQQEEPSFFDPFLYAGSHGRQPEKQDVFHPLLNRSPHSFNSSASADSDNSVLFGVHSKQLSPTTLEPAQLLGGGTQDNNVSIQRKMSDAGYIPAPYHPSVAAPPLSPTQASVSGYLAQGRRDSPPNFFFQSEVPFPLNPITGQPSQSTEDVFGKFFLQADTVAASCEIIAHLPVEDQELLHHFLTYASCTMVARDRPSNPLRMYYTPMALSSPSPDRTSPVYHALLSVTATTRFNLLRSRGDNSAWEWQKVGLKHRDASYQLLGDYLRPSSSSSSTQINAGLPPSSGHACPLPEDRDEIVAATQLLLILHAVVDGDTRLVPTLLKSCKHHLKKSDAGPTSNARKRFFWSMCGMYEVFSGFSTHVATLVERGGLMLQEHIDAGLPEIDKKEEDNQIADIWGVPRESFTLAARVLSVVSRSYACKAQGELGLWEEMQLKLEANVLDTELQKGQERYSAAMVEGRKPCRVATGRALYSYSLRIFLYREVFGLRPQDYRVQSCVHSVLMILVKISIGMEVGVPLPLTVAGSSALGGDRQAFGLFAKRCKWKGSPAPEAAERILHEVWKDIDGRSWRDVLVSFGSPLLT